MVGIKKYEQRKVKSKKQKAESDPLCWDGQHPTHWFSRTDSHHTTAAVSLMTLGTRVLVPSQQPSALVPFALPPSAGYSIDVSYG